MQRPGHASDFPRGVVSCSSARGTGDRRCSAVWTKAIHRRRQPTSELARTAREDEQTTLVERGPCGVLGRGGQCGVMPRTDGEPCGMPKRPVPQARRGEGALPILFRQRPSRALPGMARRGLLLLRPAPRLSQLL